MAPVMHSSGFQTLSFRFREIECFVFDCAYGTFGGNGAKKHTKLRKGLYTLALRIDRAQVLDYLE